ncbi:DeoR family transcriptional regulator [Gilliamella apicola]
MIKLLGVSEHTVRRDLQN